MGKKVEKTRNIAQGGAKIAARFARGIFLTNCPSLRFLV
jgi:hypothetical protein